MKRKFKFMNQKLKIVFSILLGIILSVGGVYASSYLASEVSFTPSEGLKSSNVQGAIDELAEKIKTYCPNGYSCTRNQTCSGDSCKKCVKATILHTENCSQQSAYCAGDGYSNGDTITYGTIGTKGTLTTGDAFDCDVNGDGTYDAEKERFYYVTDMNASTAVLIYYNNVSGGLPDNGTAYAYNEEPDTEYHGPVTAIKQLPTTTQWSNVSLTNTTRNIIDDLGEVKVTGFSYAGYAARLLTYQEIESGCYEGTIPITLDGSISGKCKFLMENTSYSNSLMKTRGGWLETPDASISSYAFHVFSHNSSLLVTGINTKEGVRPAIEISKIDIEY